MRIGSFFSGVGGFELAFEGLGETVFLSEIDKGASKVLEHRFPGVPNLGDITQISEETVRAYQPDVIVGGFPCQDLSVAGKRAGLEGVRSGLYFEMVRLVAAARPRWVVFENVPGLLSSNGGRDMGAVLGALDELGYGWAYRVLDAQFFGVPQRRRRVIIVGHLGHATRAGQVLLEREGVPGDPPSRGEAGEAAALAAGLGAEWGSGVDADANGRILAGDAVAFDWTAGGATDKTWGGKSRMEVVKKNGIAGALSATKVQTVVYSDVPVVDPISTLQAAGGDRGYRIDAEAAAGGHLIPVFGEPARTLTHHAGRYDADTENMIVQCWTQNQRDEVRFVNGDGQITGALPAQPGAKQQFYLLIGSTPYRIDGLRVRRLTPLECERLQGFPDDWTLVPAKTLKSGEVRLATDSARYKQMGNAVAVPAIRWVAERLAAVEARIKETAA